MNAPSKSLNDQFVAPIRFEPDVERPVVDEAATITGLIATMRYIAEKTFADGGHAIALSMPSPTAFSRGILRSTRDFQASLLRDCLQNPETTRW